MNTCKIFIRGIHCNIYNSKKQAKWNSNLKKNWDYPITNSKIKVLRVDSVQFSRSVVSDSLWPHELQPARPPCPSPTPRVHSNSRLSSQWRHPAIFRADSYWWWQKKLSQYCKVLFSNKNRWINFFKKRESSVTQEPGRKPKWSFSVICKANVKVLVTQLCQTLCNPTPWTVPC